MSQKLSQVTESVIREMTRLSEKTGAINLSQGMPDFDAPPQLVEAAVEAIRRGANQYPITWGQPALRQAISAKVKDYNGIDADPENNITITCGSTEAIAAGVLALANPGDRIVVTDPFYENYVPDAIIAGATLNYVPFLEGNLELDRETLKSAMEKRPKLIILNTPNNPTGKVLSADQLKLVADLCEEYGTLAIVDEIYEHIIYDGRRHTSLATIGDMHDRTVTVSGASKTYCVTGWRVGWVLAEQKLSDSIRKVHDYLTIGAPTPLQEALVTALNFPRKYYVRLVEFYDRKRRYMMKALDEIGLEYYRPEGAYYILANAPKSFADGQDFANHLLQDVGVAVLPATALSNNKDFAKRKVRLAYCKRDATLQDAARRLKKLTTKPRQKVSARARA